MKFLRLLSLICTFLVVSAVVVADTGSKSAIVMEAMESGGYSYLRLKEPDIWIATAVMPVSVGDHVQYVGGMEMRGFFSRTLNRTFESIFFIQNVKVVSKDIEALHADALQDHGNGPAHIPKPVAIEAPKPGDIAPLVDGKTVAGVLSELTQLKNQAVSLNVKVTKVSKNIMGKNWVTLQDGTSTELSNKLLATSLEVVSPGDTVIAKGVVRTDVDLGSGYKYKVLLEEVTFAAGIE